MFGIGMPELIIILLVALIVVGPKQLPELAKSIGKAVVEFKKNASDLKSQIYSDNEAKEIKEIKKNFDDINPTKNFPVNKKNNQNTEKL